MYLNSIVFTMWDLLVNDMTGDALVEDVDRGTATDIGIGFADDLILESDSGPMDDDSAPNESDHLLVDAGMEQVNYDLS